MELKHFFAQDIEGNVIPNATVYVYEAGTTTIASGLEDKDGNFLPVPFYANEDGLIQFAAPNGVYDLRVVSGLRDYVLQVQVFDVKNGSSLPVTAAGTGTERTLAEWIGGQNYVPDPPTVQGMKDDPSLTVGCRVEALGRKLPGDGGAGVYEIVAAGTGTHDDGVYIDLPTSGLQARGLLGDSANLRHFGAVGDGVADDTSAVRNAIRSGKVLHWGGDESVYRITEEIIEDVDGLVCWKSDGATILYDAPSPTRHAVKIGFDNSVAGIHYIGNLTIDANKKAFQGFSGVNKAGSITGSEDLKKLPAVNHEDFGVTGVYRISQDFPGGDGIIYSGAFRSIIFTRPRVWNCLMAPGAEIFNSQGIFGITCTRSDGGETHYLKIEDPYIEDIASEDRSYTNDQDAIRNFVSYAGTSPVSTNTSTFEVVGGRIINAGNRSIKSQSHFGKVRGVQIVKTDKWHSGNGTNPDIDFQVGSGGVSQIEFSYDGYAPTYVVNETFRAENPQIPSTQVAQIRGVLKNVSLNGVLALGYETGAPTHFNASIDQVDVVGAVDHLFRVRASSNAPAGRSTFTATACTASVNDAILSASGNGDLIGNLLACNNTSGSDVPIVTDDSISQGRRFSQSGCTGVSTVKRLIPGEGVPAALRVDQIIPASADRSGSVRYSSVVLGDGETHAFENHGYNGNTHLLELVIGVTSNTIGIFGVDNFGVTKLSSGSDIAVGANSEPASGNFRLWVDIPVEGPRKLMISNRSGYSRQVFARQVG